MVDDSYRDFLRKEYGVKVDRYLAWRYMTNYCGRTALFLQNRSLKIRKQVGNVTNEDLHYLANSSPIEKTCNHDDMQHHDRTRWQKNKIVSKARTKERRNKLSSGSAFHDNVM